MQSIFFSRKLERKLNSFKNISFIHKQYAKKLDQKIQFRSFSNNIRIRKKKPRELLINDSDNILERKEEIEMIYFKHSLNEVNTVLLKDDRDSNSIQIEKDQILNSEADLIKPKITIIGVGGGGCNSVNNMYNFNSVENVKLVACNTDSKTLFQSNCKHKIQLGSFKTKGLGSGSNPLVGREAALESLDSILPIIKDSNFVFIVAGLGGGTGSGAAPVIAQACKEQGILTCALVTLPFSFEGKSRMKIANEAVNDLRDIVDTCIVIPNDNLIENSNHSILNSFHLVDEALYKSVKGIIDIIAIPGIINCDFADVRRILSNNRGLAFISTGEASGVNRAEIAAQNALNNPLLQFKSIHKAKRVLINVAGTSESLKLKEFTQITNILNSIIDKDSLVIVSVTPMEEMGDTIRVTLIITDAEENNL